MEKYDMHYPNTLNQQEGIKYTQHNNNIIKKTL